MADENLATDMSGRPIRRPTAEELIAEDVSDLVSYDVVAVMADGTRLADTGGKYYTIRSRTTATRTGTIRWTAPRWGAAPEATPD